MEKIVCQLDENNYFIGVTIADESPLEKGIFLIPAGAIDVPIPEYKENFLIKWDGTKFIYEEIKKIEEKIYELTYDQLRQREYPPMSDYLDGIVKGDQDQINKYIQDCLLVKQKYPKPEVIL